jgi:hypothetical protein
MFIIFFFSLIFPLPLYSDLLYLLQPCFPLLQPLYTPVEHEHPTMRIEALHIFPLAFPFWTATTTPTRLFPPFISLFKLVHMLLLAIE